MKRIQITEIQPPNENTNATRFQMYRVYFPSGTIHFPSEKKARTFLNECNRLLNSKLIEINYLLAETLKQWQLTWLFKPWSQECDRTHQILIEINNEMRRVTQKAMYSSFHPIKVMCNVCEMLLKCTNTMAAFHKKMNNTMDLKLMECHSAQISEALNYLQGFPGHKEIQVKKITVAGMNPNQSYRVVGS